MTPHHPPPPGPSPAASFLKIFHDDRPGITSQAFGALPMSFRNRLHLSSYHVLADAIPASSAGPDVLDLACGDGFLLALLAERRDPAPRVCGIDQSTAELRAAAERLGPTVPLIEGSAHALPFGDRAFDCVLCHMALMLMDDMPQVLREIHRVLRPGGVLAAIVGFAGAPTIASQAFLAAISRYPVKPEYAGLRFGDARWRSAAGIEELLAPLFERSVIDELTATSRRTPDEIWGFFADTYDLGLRTASDQQQIRQDFMAAVEDHCGADGRLESSATFRYVEATAVRP